MEIESKLYEKLVREHVKNTKPADTKKVENAIRDLCKYWENEAKVPEPKQFIWFDSPLAASRFIDANATVTQNGVRWKGWDASYGAKPPFHCGWGAYYSYIVAAMTAYKAPGHNVHYQKIQETLLQTGPWYLFEEATVCVDTPEEVEFNEVGFITRILYRDGMEYTMIREGDEKDYPPRFSPEYSLRDNHDPVKHNFPLGECTTDMITSLDDCAIPTIMGSQWLDNQIAQEARRYGRRSMYSLHSMGVVTVDCALHKLTWADLVSTAVKRVKRP